MNRYPFLLLLLFSAAAPALELTLTVHPVYVPERAHEVYRPLVSYLTTTTQHVITLKTPKNFHSFGRDVLKNRELELVLCEAHLADYLISRHGFHALVRAVEPTAYTLVTTGNLVDAGLDGLIGRRTVSLPSPSMSSVLLSQWYGNPLRQPRVVSTAQGWRDAVEIVFAQEAEAAMVPTWLADRYPNLYALKQSESFPGMAVLASPDIDVDTQLEITEALLKLHEDERLLEVLVELNVNRLVAVEDAEFAGASKLLRNVYGFLIKPPG